MKKKSKPKEQRVECAFDSMVAIGDIKPNPRNPNLHPKKQIELLAKIIKANTDLQIIFEATARLFKEITEIAQALSKQEATIGKVFSKN